MLEAVTCAVVSRGCHENGVELRGGRGDRIAKAPTGRHPRIQFTSSLERQRAPPRVVTFALSDRDSDQQSPQRGVARASARAD